MPHASLRIRPTRSKKCIHYSAQRTDRVVSWTPSLPHDKHLDRTQLSHIHVQVKVPEDLAHLAFWGALHVPKRLPRNVNRANLRNIDSPCSVDHKVAIERHLSPHLDHQLISRTNDVIRGHRHHIERCEGGRRDAEELRPKDRQHLSG